MPLMLRSSSAMIPSTIWCGSTRGEGANAMADINGLLADPRFGSLSPAQQKQVLGRIDPAFSNLSDADLQDFKSRMQATSAPSRSFINTGISAQPQPQGIGARVAQWAGNAADDLRYGGDTTVVGQVAHQLGLTPLTHGAPPAVSDFMASPVLGPLRTLRGAGEVATPGQRMQGGKDLVGGLAQTAQ